MKEDRLTLFIFVAVSMAALHLLLLGTIIKSIL